MAVPHSPNCTTCLCNFPGLSKPVFTVMVLVEIFYKHLGGTVADWHGPLILHLMRCVDKHYKVLSTIMQLINGLHVGATQHFAEEAIVWNINAYSFQSKTL